MRTASGSAAARGRVAEMDKQLAEIDKQQSEILGAIAAVRERGLVGLDGSETSGEADPTPPARFTLKY